ncbi:ADP-ribosylglycohydrolase family protein [Halarchaeum sp. P4]|uniref:ADP-ribosylglycohydrolase family protein n=1 Tax=Halarchaeum sp. P4 TaxID=3421639 RepID=UPI003EBA7179
MDENRASGVLLGLACGDALGRPVEFESGARIAERHGTLTEMVGHGTWNKPAGTLTDDTDQALCVAESLRACDGFDGADVAERFVAWYESGPFDVGGMTRRALQRLQRGDAWDEAGERVWEASPEGSNAGNGSVMRTPPVAVAYHDDPEALDRVSRDVSRITHADPRCTYGCVVLDRTIAGLLGDAADPLADALDAVRGDAPAELLDALAPVADGREIAVLRTTGYVVHTLQTALHDALCAESAEDAIVTAVNRGGDTDTVGAVAGAVAGARFGADALPERWLDVIDERERLESLALELAAR